MSNTGLVLYGDHRSGNCYKVAWILKQTGRDFRWVETDVLKAETRSDEFLAMNPNGKVPLLKLRSGRFLAESNAMLIHIARGSKFMPRDHYFESLVYQWLFFEQYSHEPYIAVARFLLHFDHGLEVEPERIQILHQRGEQALGVMEEVLGRQKFITGEQFTIADIALYAYTHVAADGGFDLSAMPEISGWMERISAQPGHFDLKDLPDCC